MCYYNEYININENFLRKIKQEKEDWDALYHKHKLEEFKRQSIGLSGLIYTISKVLFLIKAQG